MKRLLLLYNLYAYVFLYRSLVIQMWWGKYRKSWTWKNLELSQERIWKDDPWFLFLFRLAGVMRIKNKKLEALWYGMSTSRASDIDVSHLNYYWQVIEISFRFLRNAVIFCNNCFPYFLSLAKNAAKQVMFCCLYLASFLGIFTFYF